MKLGVLFGGASSEHQISIVSGTSVIANLDKTKYDIYPIYISYDGNFYEYTKNIEDIKVLTINDEIKELKKIDNIWEYLQKLDVIFPVLHGKNGEDGTIQGLLTLLKKRYVGCHVLASSLCMDKVYTKALLNKALIKQAKSMYIKKVENKYLYIDEYFDSHVLDKDELIDYIEDYLHYPVFVKPSNSGSSVGVNKASKDNVLKYIDYAFTFDDKVLIEEEIKGREVECGIIGSNNPLASTVGEIITPEHFYSFASKYQNNTSQIIIPSTLNDEVINEIKKIALKAYLTCNCEGLARIDFFVQDNNDIILNEINTLPGFTEISMYPKLMESLGFNYTTLLDKLIELA